jgi:periplasmic protein TonB
MNYTHVVPTQSRRLAGFTPVRLGWHRAREVPATGIPGPRDRRRNGTIISFLFHALLLLFLFQSPALHIDPNLKPLNLGAGGPGPVGGGGGGNRGTGGVRYIQVAPPPKPVAPPVTPLPVIVPPKPPEPVLPQLEIPKLAQEAKMLVKIQSPIIGLGGGTGIDGTKGNGPGTGGGIGSGLGTGNGSAVGPGTGGGNTDIHAPTMTELFIPPLPLPSGVKGSQVLAEFDVDETGKVLSFKFTPTKDRGYNKKLEEVLKGFKFRPGTTMQGVPVRAKFQMTLSLSG